MRVKRIVLFVIPFLLLGWGSAAAAQSGNAASRMFDDGTPISDTTITVTVTTSDGNPIPAGTEIQVVKVDPEPSTMLHDETLGTDQPSGYQILNLPTDSAALYSVNVFPSSGYAAIATGTSHGGVNIDVEIVALPPTPTPEPSPTATITPSPTATSTPTETLPPTTTATIGDVTPASTATLAPTKPANVPTATVQVSTLPTTGQGTHGSGSGIALFGLLSLAIVSAGLASWRIRRR